MRWLPGDVSYKCADALSVDVPLRTYTLTHSHRLLHSTELQPASCFLFHSQFGHGLDSR